MFTPHFPDESFAPLSHNLFLNFVIVPFIAANLIGEDSGQSAEVAWERTMIPSGDYGDIINGDVDDDSELDAIVDLNLRASKKVKPVVSKNKGRAASQPKKVRF